MEQNALLSALEKKASGAILKKQKFGRSSDALLWCEAKRLREVSSLLVQQGMDWLEHLSVAQLEKAFMVTYFVRPTLEKKESGFLALRVSLEAPKDFDRVDLPTVRDIWATAAAPEEEVSELYGIRLVDGDGKPLEIPPRLVVGQIRGFPLRKNFVFPKEVCGIAHSRERPKAVEE